MVFPADFCLPINFLNGADIKMTVPTTYLEIYFVVYKISTLKDYVRLLWS